MAYKPIQRSYIWKHFDFFIKFLKILEDCLIANRIQEKTIIIIFITGITFVAINYFNITVVSFLDANWLKSFKNHAN